jgi:hypothetical protein
MDWIEYSQQTASTAVYPNENAAKYLVFGFKSEVGEVFGRLKKVIRGDSGASEKVASEIADCYWYLSELHRNFATVPLCLSGAAVNPCSERGCHPWAITNDPLMQLDALSHRLFIHLHDTGTLTPVEMNRWSQLAYDCLGRLAKSHGLEVSDLLASNAAKLQQRKATGTIRGDGEQRS